METKKWWQSKTIIGGIVAIGSGLAGLLGYNIDQQTQEDLTNIILQVSAIVGGALAVYGRVKARTIIGK